MHDHTIYIVGAGAIGKVLAAMLKLSGKEIVLVRGSVDDGRRTTETIEVELPDNSFVNATIDTVAISTIDRFEGLVVFTNKSFGNATLVQALRAKVKCTPILIMQNGLDVELPFIDAGFDVVYRCVLFATSQPIAANRFRFRPVEPSPIGRVAGEGNVKEVVEALQNDQFPFRGVSDIKPIVWTKSIVNCVFNSICPLLETDNGIFHRNAYALSLAKRVIAECTDVARATGIQLNVEAVLSTLLRISQSSDGQLISTYQDILHRRPTEIETLNLAVVRVAEKIGMWEAVKETRLLGELIHLKSALNQER